MNNLAIFNKGTDNKNKELKKTNQVDSFNMKNEING